MKLSILSRTILYIFYFTKRSGFRVKRFKFRVLHNDRSRLRVHPTYGEG